MNNIERKYCCVCRNKLNNKNKDYKILLPKFQGVTNEAFDESETDKLIWNECNKCFTVQLKKLINEKIVYQNSHATGLGDAWVKHHNKFAEFIYNLKLENIVEIGGGNCILSNIFVKKYKSNWTIIDPNLSGTPINGVNFIKGLLTDDFLFSNENTSLVMSHTFEHFYNPSEMLKKFRKSVIKNIIISFPDMKKWIENNIYGVLNFEHTFFITIENLIILFKNNGYLLIDQHHYSGNNSKFLHFRLDLNLIEYNDYINVQSLNSIQQFFCKMINNISNINKVINQKNNENVEIYLMPASIYTQYLISNGLNYVDGLIDNSAYKQNKRLFGTKLKIYSLNQVIQRKVKLLIILNSGFHSKEIIKQLKDYKSYIDIEVI